ncbi:MAG TPA: hypothetical protein VNO82_08160 [Solirubrobacteraceae bacterium]|nr:hypothetical protein [Solirubrobacteraceae bacterium]
MALVRGLAGVLGFAVFAAGAVAVFVTENGTGAAAMLAIGAAFMAFAALGDRIQSLELGGVKLTIRDLARQTYALAREAEHRGDDEAADRLRAVAAELEALARAYRHLRGSMKAGDKRTRVLDDLVLETQSLAESGAFEAADVIRWFEQGTPEARITALALMQGNPRLRDFGAALDAIADSRSAFEQYHGLALAETMLDDLGTTDRAQLTVVTERALRSRRVKTGTDRHELGEQILARLRAA